MIDTKKSTILIVDDTPLNIKVLAEALKNEYNIKVASSGEQALKMLENETKPDLILLDVMMPKLDGYEVCKRIKDDNRLMNIPVMFVTAKNEVEDQTHGLELGAVDYITKPFHIPIVKARVRNHVNLKKKSDLLESLVHLDGLTGIANRRRMDEVLEVEVKRAVRSGLPISVAMLDVDHFKNFNDNYGHGAGDECLVKIADAISSTLERPADMLARYGGEEFVLILPETDEKGALSVAQKAKESVEKMGMHHAFSTVASVVTVSIGCATIVPSSDEDSAKILKMADDALYTAKNRGRNIVCQLDTPKQ
jgi:diguanylate cyclase (GGDEF)-like protein